VSKPGACSDNTSNVQQSGQWITGTADSSIAGTSAYYLTSTIPTSNPTYPSVTFYPHVSASGYYDIYIVIPGCANLGVCDGRTSVDIEVFPVQGGLGWTSTISEQVQADTKTLVYSGPVDASSGAFSPTVSLALAKSPLSVTGNYIVVAEAVEMVLTGITNSTSNSSRTSGSAVNGSILTSSSSQTAFGMFEWSSSTVNATSTLSSTPLTQLGFALDTAYNVSGLPPAWSINAIAVYGSTIFVAGNFTASGNYSNVVSVDTTSGTVTPLASQGLNQAVSSAAVVGDYVYFGGEFTSTATNGGSLNHLARYDPKGNAWAAIGGVDGPVASLIPSSSSLIVLGNFSNVVASDGTSTQTGGYAVWDTSKSAWSTSGAIFGNVSAAATSDTETFLAGKVSGSSNNPASGFAMLSTGNDGSATITSLNANLDSAHTPSSSPSRRSLNARRHSHTWLSRFTSALVRATPALLPRAMTAPSIPTQPAPAPAVLAGGFWTNSSASDKPMVTILGGNLSTSTGGLAFYTSGNLSYPDPPVQGVVRALEVIRDTVYLGGAGVSVSGSSGIVAYKLEIGTWMTSGMPSLNSPSGTALTVHSIRSRSGTNTVVVAGNFATAGSLSCAAVCLWDSEGSQWSTPGSGLTSGEVRSIDFGDESYDLLIVAGSFVMSDGSVAYAASYSFINSSWTALGTLPGPALAITVDNKNASNVFAAGYFTADASPYLEQWNGQTWTAQNQSLLSGSIVQQLAFVPISTEHTAAGSIENDRMLMVSGELSLQASGNVTSALYDGATWYPYLVGSSSTGDIASASQLFWSSSRFSFAVRHFLAKGLVVLVAIAIATALILLLVLLALLIAHLTRRSERRQPNRDMSDKDSDISSTHQHVFNNVQAALEQSLIGGSATAAIAAARQSGASHYDPAEGEGSEEDDGRETTMRYDFEGPELQPGELSMRAGQRIHILDDVQSDEWWYARDPMTGREGVVPATYGQCGLLSCPVR